MRRRDFVKGIVVVPAAAKAALGQQSAAPVMPSPQAAAANSAPLQVDTFRRQPINFKPPAVASLVPDAVAQTEARFFNDLQLATLRKLSDILMPPLDGYPGALQAEAPEFIDFLIGTSPPDQQQMYQSGLDRLNTEAKKQFGIQFTEVNAAQADQLIRPWLATWINDHPPAEPFTRFINLAHHDIRTATMNSRAWSVAATSSGERAPGMGLYWSPIDPDIQRYV
ncbi:MAG TPA: gluconate 2-dehydrogenase subunit 3 family protein [Acidobacteriaceae bacterium]